LEQISNLWSYSQNTRPEAATAADRADMSGPGEADVTALHDDFRKWTKAVIEAAHR